MTRVKRQFTPEEKLSILQEAEREGQTETCRKYNLSASVLQYWKKKYLTMGKEGLKPAHKRVDPKLREMEEEIEMLKRIIAKQTIEIEFKTELIKKNQAHLLKGKK